MTQHQLPSMPGTVVKLLQMFADADVCIDDIVDTIKTDPAMSGRILKAANSSAVSSGREISDLKRAAMMLGKKTVSTLALSFSLKDKSGDTKNPDLYQVFWDQSIVAGATAAMLAKQSRGMNPDEAFLAGLLSRIGRLGALSAAGDEFAEHAAACEKNGYNLDDVYLEGLGMSCDEMTLEYLRMWMLPDEFIELIRSTQAYEYPETFEVDSPELDACSLLRIAVATGKYVAGENTGIALATIHDLMKPSIQGCPDQLNAYIEKVQAEVASYRQIMDAGNDTPDSPAELQARAMAHIAEVAMAPETEPPAKTTERSGEVDWLKSRVRDLTNQLAVDPLTTVNNRAYFESNLAQHVAAARLIGGYVSVLFIDVNEFKPINDNYGHDVGDEVIRLVATTLKMQKRRDDILARYGGDEFVVLLNSIDGIGLPAQAKRVADSIANLKVEVRGDVLPISLAIGGAIGIPDGSHDFADRLVREADEAMYESKKHREGPVTRVMDTVPVVTDTRAEPTAV